MPSSAMMFQPDMVFFIQTSTGDDDMQMRVVGKGSGVRSTNGNESKDMKKHLYKLLRVAALILLVLSILNSTNSFYQTANLAVIANTSLRHKLAAHRVNYKDKLTHLLIIKKK